MMLSPLSHSSSSPTTSSILLIALIVIFLADTDRFVASWILPSYPLKSRGTKQAVPFVPQTVLFAGADSDNPKSAKQKSKKKSNTKKKKTSNSNKEALVKEISSQMKNLTASSTEQTENDKNLIDRLNPFKAGQKLRQTIDTALTSIQTEEKKKSSIYYMDDRFSSLSEGDGTLLDDDYIPEVLVVGATGEAGRLVVQRLLLNGRSRVRVLVRDLYTKTLNLFGTGVTYCQGDLSNMETLEYAVTDVDKIIFCPNTPRPDEEQFQEKFREFVEENSIGTSSTKDEDEMDWEQLDSILQVRAQLAEKIDLIGLRNLLQAFQNVRHADYGTSQAAKRSLFKFQSRPEDFNLFGLDNDAGTEEETDEVEVQSRNDYEEEYNTFFDDEDEDDDYNDTTEYDASDIESRRDRSSKAQTQWMQNQFGHGVFVGRVPQATDGRDGGEAAVMSSRLRSRRDPENGIDLGMGFGGFVARVCSDGGTYEAFVRTGAYYEDGVEYSCNFSTATKVKEGRNKSKNKFVTVRLPFESFKPVQRKASSRELGGITAFTGNDVRNIGFRYSSANNRIKSSLEPDQWSQFYLALSYIKLYRSLPEPEIVYVSDAQIPPVVRNNMVRHEAKQLVSVKTEGTDDQGGVVRLLDDATLQDAMRSDAGRQSSPEETYYKYRGEELIRASGLNYAIARISGYNEIPAAETSTIDIRASNEDMVAMSRSEVAQVCVSALMDPNALNKSFYVTKKAGTVTADREEEDMREKFSGLPVDEVS